MAESNKKMGLVALTTLVTVNMMGSGIILLPSSMAQLGAVYAPHARFKDPFNEVTGTTAIRRIFEHMFATTDAPRFVVTDCIEQGEQAIMRKLATAGAFHTQFMAPALDGYAAAAAKVTTSEPNAILLSNLDGQPLPSAAAANDLTRPSRARPRWRLKPMNADGVDMTVAPPASSVTGCLPALMRS